MAILEFQGLIPFEIRLPESPRHMEVETFLYSPSPERFADYSHVWMYHGGQSGPEKTFFTAASPGGGFFYEAPQVSLFLTEEGDADIRYTLDDSQPGASSPLFTEAFFIHSPCTLRARAFVGGKASGPVTSWVFEVRTPVLVSPDREPGRYYKDLAVMLSSDRDTLHFTTDGSPVDTVHPVWGEAVALPRPGVTLLRARTFTQWNGIWYASGPEALLEYDLRPPATVTAVPPEGDYLNRVTVSLFCSDVLLPIRYTLDGSPPGDSGTLYGSPLTLTDTRRLSAVALWQGEAAGPVAVWDYTILVRVEAFLEYRWRDVDAVADRSLGLAWSWAAGLNQLLVDMVWEFLWADARSADMLASLLWSVPDGVNPENLLGWEENGHVDGTPDLAWAEVAVSDREHPMAWDGILSADDILHLAYAPALGVERHQALIWDMAAALDAERDLRWRMGCFADRARDLAFAEGRQADRAMGLPWGLGGWKPHTPDPPPGAWIEARREWQLPYLTTASVIMYPQQFAVVRVSDGAVIPTLSVSCSMDDNSWAIDFQGVILGADAAARLRPGPDGEVEVEITVSGYRFRCLVDDVTSRHTWGQGVYSFSGASPSVVLGGDGAPKSSRVFADLPARQVVAEILRDTGWSWDWQLPENLWPITGYSVRDATAMDMLAGLIRDAGGIIQTHPHERTLILMSGYPVSPSRFGAQIPDDWLHQGLLSSASRRVRSPRYNAVLVSGVHSGQVMRIVRSGTAGDRPAPDVAGENITAPWVNQEKGRTLLAAQGYDKIEHSYTAALPPQDSGTRPRLMQVCDLVEVTDPFEERVFRGRVKSVTVAAAVDKNGKNPTTRQSVTVEEYLVS